MGVVKVNETDEGRVREVQKTEPSSGGGHDGRKQLIFICFLKTIKTLIFSGRRTLPLMTASFSAHLPHALLIFH